MQQSMAQLLSQTKRDKERRGRQLLMINPWINPSKKGKGAQDAVNWPTDLPKKGEGNKGCCLQWIVRSIPDKRKKKEQEGWPKWRG